MRLQFDPSERKQVAASYTWPMVEGLVRLVRVRRRQDNGTREIAAFPQLLENEDKARPDLVTLAKAPVGFAVYAMVAAGARGRPFAADGWSRGR